MKTIYASLSIALAFAFSNAAQAAPASYPTPGIENLQTYRLVASSDNTVAAYFTGADAGHTTEIALLVNGVMLGNPGLVNHATAYGTPIVFGNVKAGDILTFELLTDDPTGVPNWYSDVGMNADGKQHVYITPVEQDGIIPQGIAIGFEDLPNGGDFDYNDENFVFTNITATNAVPEPASLALFGLGLAGLGLRRKMSRSK